MSDIRASSLEEGDQFREYGDDDVHTVQEMDWHGDTVLITTTENLHLSFDCDEVIERQDN